MESENTYKQHENETERLKLIWRKNKKKKQPQASFLSSYKGLKQI